MASIAIEPGDPTIPAHLDGSIERPRKWLRTFRRGGTDEFMFAAFCEHICGSFETHPAPALEREITTIAVRNTTLHQRV
jgi:hypothetical protein